ncbi:MAG TPA: FAD-dependent oxidoreductase [Mobilitalea sp.]|nr:FAD-dependent oxidoreductase [Mobilitalea sp.]
MNEGSEKKGGRSLVKCLVCGDIFDSSLDICPVCGVGREFFVPYEEEQTSFSKDTSEVFVILGNGAAGISAAEAIRERNSTCSITMISNESVLSYNRPMLTKALSTLLSAEEIEIHDNDWYQNNNITNILGIGIEMLDPVNKAVIFTDGTQLNYDKCIYALGAECFIPPFSGTNKPEVIAIRNIADVMKIRELQPKVKNTVVIGGGVLGLEAAWEMSKFSNVTVLESADKLMVRQLDDEAGELLGELIRGANIGFCINANITEITGDESVTGVKLESGEIFPADLVIISCGIRANAIIAKEAGIEIKRAVVVNDKLETSDPYIYACGDCAEYQGINYAIWSQALEMGKLAGANAAGDALSYEIIPAALTFEGMNTALFAAGDNGKNPELQYRTKTIRDEAGKNFEKYYFVDDRLVGVILIGDTTKLVDLTAALQDKRTYQKLFTD